MNENCNPFNIIFPGISFQSTSSLSGAGVHGLWQPGSERGLMSRVAESIGFEQKMSNKLNLDTRVHFRLDG